MSKKPPSKKHSPEVSDKPSNEQAAAKGLFKQPLKKPQPWSFGGGGKSYGSGPAAGKPGPDADRRGGKSRKVH